MDFWQRLIAGTSLSPANGKTTPKTYSSPDKRLQRFKREYNQLLHIWRTTADISKHNDTTDSIKTAIQELTALLSDEARRPSPHVCISFAASKQIYIPIAKIATTSYNEPIIREAVTFFGTLVESEEEDFLENAAFSQSLMGLLIRITGANSLHLGSDAEVEVVELAFGIAAKIRLQPEILPAWFTETHKSIQQGKSAHVNQHDKFTGKTHRADFPLFYLLIDYIHHEGRVGDFARTGLLYIIESAATSEALEQWIVESDLATLMATGLGALYSQLSRKLVIDYLPEQLPPVLELSDYQHPISTSEITSSASEDFQGHMETFLSHLMFWQDVLEHCKSVEVKQTLLEHFQVIFLQQLLYPSLLESSDIDGEISGGGSSVAVLTYLRRVLEALNHPDMIHMILQYLLALPEAKIKNSGTRANVSAALQRKSNDLQTMLAQQSASISSPAIYNLVDLILGTLESHNQQTVGASLQLLSIMLRKHHRYAVTTLLQTSNLVTSADNKTIQMHESDLDFLTGLIDVVGIEQGIEEAYEHHVKDIMSLLECHPCSQELILPKSADGIPKSPNTETTIPGSPRAVTRHSLRVDDPILNSLITLLQSFYTNPVEVNLCLTETIVNIATCGFLELSGWLLPDVSEYALDFVEDDTSRDEQDNSKSNHQDSVRAPAQRPLILIVLAKLAHQTSLYRSQIPRFDDLLAQRHVSLSENTMQGDLRVPHHAVNDVDEFDVVSSLAIRPVAKTSSTSDSLAFRMFSDFTSRSRSDSGDRSQETANSQPGTPTPASKNPLTEFVTGLSEVIRPVMTPTKGRQNEEDIESSVCESVGVEESQARAFKEVDDAILARRVTLPSEVAVPFPKLQKTSTIVKEADVNMIESESTGEENADIDEGKTVSVSHILTNVLILHEFLLEIIALLQVRASLFGGIAYS